MLKRLLLPLALLVGTSWAGAQELPDEGQSEAAFQQMLAKKPVFRSQVAELEKWLRTKHVHGVLHTWQILRTASMWKVCNGPPFEVPPRKLWGNLAATLRFVRDHVRPALGPLQAVSAYRNPVLNVCARGSANSAHRDFSALDLVPDKPLTRRQIFYQVCRVHALKGPANGAGLGFYAFARFHVDTRSFRRWGSAGPGGNESPCAVLERGEDPEAPPHPRLEGAPPATAPEVPPPTAPEPANASSGPPTALN
jgi:hypothetical protein